MYLFNFMDIKRINGFCTLVKKRKHSSLDPYFQFGGDVFFENRSAPVLYYMPPREYVPESRSKTPVSFNFSVRKSVVCQLHTPLTLTFRNRASCILGQAFHYSPENAFYIFNQQIYFII